MNFPFGKYLGTAVSRCLFVDPDYFFWFLGKTDVWGDGLRVKTEVLRLIAEFDRQPLLLKCHGCGASATFVTAVAGRTESMYPWCDSCDPRGNTEKATTRIRQLVDAQRHVRTLLRGKKDELRKVVLTLARYKGLSKPITAAKLEAFFNADSGR